MNNSSEAEKILFEVLRQGSGIYRKISRPREINTGTKEEKSAPKTP